MSKEVKYLIVYKGDAISMKGIREMRRLSWMMISIAIIISLLLFFNVFGLSFSSLFSKSGHTIDPNDEELLESIEEVQATVGDDQETVSDFIAQMHQFYNETTGYGAINSLDWEEQRKHAKEVVEAVDEHLSDIDDEALVKDLKYIKKLAEEALEYEKKSSIRDLHRMFHDLDVALNNYDEYDKIWNVTETLKLK